MLRELVVGPVLVTLFRTQMPANINLGVPEVTQVEITLIRRAADGVLAAKK